MSKTDTDRTLRVALIQIDSQPAASLAYSYLEEPVLLNEGEQGITSLPPSLPGFDELLALRAEIRREYERFMENRLNAILAKMEDLAVDLAVFPEYSIPASCLAKIGERAGLTTIVAASHTVTQESVAQCALLGLNLSSEDLGKSICPIFSRGIWRHIDKLSKSRWENTMRVGSHWAAVEIIGRSGESFSAAVLLCIDFINDLEDSVRDKVPRDLWRRVDIGLIPSYSPSTRDFDNRARAVAERSGIPVIYSNVASLGGSRINCNFIDVGGFTERSGTKPLGVNEEAIVVADLPIGTYAQFNLQPSPIPTRPASQVKAVLPLLSKVRFESFLRLRDQVRATGLDDQKRNLVERAKPGLIAMSAEPWTPNTLKLKIFELLSSMSWRDGDWLDSQLDALPLDPDDAVLDERRFLLLYKTQRVLAGIVNNPRVTGSGLDRVTEVLRVYRRSIDALRPRMRPEIVQQIDANTLAIHTVAQDQEKSFTSLFVMRLKSERIHRDSLEKQVKLISTLAHPSNQDLALNLRYISIPNPGGNLKNLDVHIVGAARATDRSASREIADGFRRDLADLMRVTLRDAYLFELEELDQPELSKMGEPFPLNHIIELFRLIDFGTPPYVDTASFPRIFHLEGNSSLSRVLDMLQSQSSACIMSVHLHPAKLASAEQSFFKTYRRAAQKQDSMEGAMFFLGTEQHPALRLNDVLTIQHMLGDGENRQPNLVLRLFLASPDSIPPLLINAIGSEFWGNDSYQVIKYDQGTEAHRLVADSIRQSWALSCDPPPAGSPELLRRVPVLFDQYEASKLFRLPLDGYSGAVPNLFSVLPAPAAALPQEGIEIGLGFHSGAEKALVVRLDKRERTKHAYIVGKTGTGKSTLLARMIGQDIASGNGVCVIDPHGDLVDSVLRHMPETRVDDVVLLDPTASDNPFGLNLLETNSLIAHHKDLVLQDTIGIMRKLFYFEHGGPVFEHVLRHLVLTMLDDSMDGQGTLIEVPRPLYDDAFRRKIVPRLRDELAQDFWSQYDRMGSYASEYIWYVVSKFDTFTTDRIMRNIIGQSRSTINFHDILHDRRILLVKLPSALIGELNAALLGMIVVSKLRAAGMARAALPPEKRSVYNLYVDEFQNFAASGFDSILAEARKYGLSLVLAHQHIGQLSAFDISSGTVGDKTSQAIFGNIGTMIVFRVGVRDAKFLADELGKPVDPQDLENLKSYHAIVKTIFDGEVHHPFTIRTLMASGGRGEETIERIRARSLDIYTTPRHEVENALRVRLSKMMGEL